VAHGVHPYKPRRILVGRLANLGETRPGKGKQGRLSNVAEYRQTRLLAMRREGSNGEDRVPITPHQPFST
jgi:hypothetical protein